MKRSLFLMAVILIPVVVFAQAAKLAPELLQTPANKPVPVIVQYKNIPLADRQGVVSLQGSKVTGQLGVINGIRAVVPAESLAALAADPKVAYV